MFKNNYPNPKVTSTLQRFFTILSLKSYSFYKYQCNVFFSLLNQISTNFHNFPYIIILKAFSPEFSLFHYFLYISLFALFFRFLASKPEWAIFAYLLWVVFVCSVKLYYMQIERVLFRPTTPNNTLRQALQNWKKSLALITINTIKYSFLLKILNYKKFFNYKLCT